MDINEICKRGHYDKVTLNLVTEPVYGDDIEIYGNTDFYSSISISNKYLDRSIFKVRFNILGVEYIKKQVIKVDELAKEQNRKAVLYKIGINGAKNYLLAYADLIVVQDGSRLDYLDERFSDDKELLVDTALRIQERSRSNSSVVIVDRVYVYDRYRSCGISRWIHSNIREILYEYMGIQIGDMLLIPGDFSDEAKSKFGMTYDDYIEFLKNHYKSIGYTQQRNGIMINKASTNNLYMTSSNEIVEKSKTLLGSIADFLSEVIKR